MGILTFSINVTLDGCVDHQEGIANDETHAFFIRLLDEGGAMLWGRVTYEMMEGYWPAVARGDQAAPPLLREWAVKLDAKPKYVVSSTRKDFPWPNCCRARWLMGDRASWLMGIRLSGALSAAPMMARRDNAPASRGGLARAS